LCCSLLLKKGKRKLYFVVEVGRGKGRERGRGDGWLGVLSIWVWAFFWGGRERERETPRTHLHARMTLSTFSLLLFVLISDPGNLKKICFSILKSFQVLVTFSFLLFFWCVTVT